MNFKLPTNRKVIEPVGVAKSGCKTTMIVIAAIPIGLWAVGDATFNIIKLLANRHEWTPSVGLIVVVVSIVIALLWLLTYVGTKPITPNIDVDDEPGE